MRVALSVGEDYPHLFVSDDPDDIRYAESPAAAALFMPHVAVEVTSQQWAEYNQAEDAYRAQVLKMDKLRDEVLAARRAAKEAKAEQKAGTPLCTSESARSSSS